jgi:hypothetical protein
VQPRFILTLLLLSLLLAACTSPPGPRGAPVPATQVQAAGAGSPAAAERSLPSGKPSIVTPMVAISGPIVDAATNTPVAADVYVDGKLTLSKTDRLVRPGRASEEAGFIRRCSLGRTFDDSVGKHLGPKCWVCNAHKTPDLGARRARSARLIQVEALRARLRPTQLGASWRLTNEPGGLSSAEPGASSTRRPPLSAV